MAEDEQKVSEEEVMEVEAEADQYGAAVVAEGEEEIDPNEGKKEWEKVVSIEDLGTAAMDDVGTPLLQAAREHNIERVKRLVLQGDEINAQHQGGDLKGMTALHWLAGDGYPEISRWLIDHGLDINLRDAWGQTALHHAAGNGHTECIKVLVEAGADVLDKDEAFGQDALHWAASKNNTDAIEWLLDNGAQVNRHDSDGGLTALHIASNFGNIPVARVLLESGANPDARDNNGRTPLFTAASQGHPEVFKMLLDAGASVAIKDNSNMTVATYTIRPEIKEVYDEYVKALKNAKKELQRLYAEGIAEWDSEEVASWLHHIKLDDYIDDFRSQQVDGPRLLAEGGALINDADVRSVLNKGLSEAQRLHQKYLDKKQDELKMDMALSAITTLILAFVILRFIRRLFA